MIKHFLIVITVVIFSIMIPAFAISVLPDNINATINTPTSATLNWKITDWDATKCDFQNVSWNEGIGPEQNPQETVDANGNGDLNIFGWHIFDIKLLMTCTETSSPDPDPGIAFVSAYSVASSSTTYEFGPFDRTIEGIVPPSETESQTDVINRLLDLNSELISMINHLLDGL